MTHADNFDESDAQGINKQNGVGNYLHRRWISSIFCIVLRRTLSSDVFERRKSSGNGPFALLSRNFEQILGQIVSLRVNILSNTNLIVPRHIKREKSSLLIDERRSKTSLLKLPIDSECEDCEWDSDYCNHDRRPLTSLDMCRRCSALLVITWVRLLLF